MPQLSLAFDSGAEADKKPVNVASVAQLSPFRYPGGKTWFVPLFRRWMQSIDPRPTLLVEPFAGGGIISLTAAFERLAAQVIMVELDPDVAAVWQTILRGEAKRLADAILHFELNTESLGRELARGPITTFDRALQTILKNRTAHGGILAEGAGVLKHGENGKGLLSRWYPQTIAKRIANIAHVAERIDFIEGDAFAVMSAHRTDAHAAFFIDPPYTAGGKRAGSRLYRYSEIDHDRLFTLCGQVRGDFLLTYDNAPEVRALAQKHGFASRPIPMKNTHHAEMTELLIGTDLSWFDAPPRVQEAPPSKTNRKRMTTTDAPPDESKPRKRVTYVAAAPTKKGRRKKD